MTAPDLQSLIAAVLEEHQFSAFSAEGHCVCTCDSVVVGEGEGWEEYADHQARAVLAALTEAGEVEWGVRWGDGAWTGHLTQEQAKDLARGPGVESIISRLTLPWAAVE